MMGRGMGWVVATAALGAILSAQAPAPQQSPGGGDRQAASGSVVVTPPNPTYDANVERRVGDALKTARDDNRRVLVVWGSNGDKASDEMILSALKRGEVARTLTYEYQVVRAEVKGNERVAVKYGAEAAKSDVPYLTVLDARGQVLANRSATAFTGADTATYDARKLNDFLVEFKPVYVNAEPLFTEALSRAKKEQKTLFLWFSAPW